MARQQGPTQKDVARRANVSVATVSYVINNRTGGKVLVSAETRRRVLAAVEDLGYQPNVTARSLRTRRTQLLAVMVPDLANPFYPLLIRGAEVVAEEHDYQLLVYDTNDRPEREQAFVQAMMRRGVDGVIAVAFHLQSADVARLAGVGIHTVTISGEGRTIGVDAVVPAERQAVHELMRYLIARGHRRIAHLAGLQDTPPGELRLQGYREALAEARIAYDEALVRYGAFRRDGVADMVASLFPPLGNGRRPTALLAANDLMAIEAMRVLGRLGLRVPQDVAVCGFDNIPEAEAVSPALTTVDQDSEAMGQRAAELLFERMREAKATPVREVHTPCRLVLRDSV